MTAASDGPLVLDEATAADLPAVAALMNRAYRGRGAAPGWCSEAAYIDGERTSPAELAADLQGSPRARLLVHRVGGTILASVRLEPADGGVCRLGALTVDPAAQAGGLGRRLLEAAEGWAAGRDAGVIRMGVVHLRDTLIAWYERRGYRLTGESEPWPYDDDRFGRPLRPDLAFVVMEKRLP